MKLKVILLKTAFMLVFILLGVTKILALGNEPIKELERGEIAPDIPNPTFEYWEDFQAYSDPEHWKTINSESVAVPLVGKVLVTKTEDSYIGEYATRLETQSVVVVAPAAMSLGRIVHLDALDRDMRGGIPSNTAPESFEGYYKYFPVDGDYAFIACILFKYNFIEDRQDTVARALFMPNQQVGEYTHFKVEMEYMPGMESVQHDTMNVVISSSFKFGAPKVGTVLYIDNLKVNYPQEEEENIIPETEKSEIFIYPNPASSYVNISSDFKDEALIQIVDIKGSVVYSSMYDGVHASVNLDTFKTGIYFLRLMSDNDVRNIKLVIK